MKSLRVLILSVPALAVLLVAASPSYAQMKIVYPAENATVPGEVVEITGTGADPKGELEIAVLTDRWYIQDGRATINGDGTWTFSPCHLAGTGVYNNHTVRVTVYRNGTRVSTATTRGVKRR